MHLLTTSLLIACLLLVSSATEYLCSSDICLFTDVNCRTLSNGEPASISNAAQNALAAQLAAGGELGLGGYYMDSDVFWEDLSTVTYTPSGFAPTTSGLIVINSAGQWRVVDYNEILNYRIVCKMYAADTTTTTLTTSQATTTTKPTSTTTAPLSVSSTTTQVASTGVPIPVTNISSASSTTTTAPLTVEPTFVTNVTAANTTNTTSNATVANWTTTIAVIPTGGATMGTNSTTINVTTVTNVTTINATTMPTNVTNMNNTNQTASVTPTPVATIPVTLPTPTVTQLNGTHPLVSAFSGWYQSLVAFTNPSRLPVAYSAPFSDGAYEYNNLVVSFTTSSSVCSSLATSQIAFDGNGTGVLTFAMPSQLMAVYADTTYYLCIADSSSGQSWLVPSASIIVVTLHRDFTSSGYRRTAIHSNLIELAVPSVSTVPFVITLSAYEAYSFAFGACNSDSRVAQSPVLADGKLFLVVPNSVTSFTSICATLISAQQKINIAAASSSLTATAHVAAIPAGHSLLISVTSATSDTVVGWIASDSTCSAPTDPSSLTAVSAASATSGFQDYAFAIPSSTTAGYYVCVGSAGSTTVVKHSSAPVTVTVMATSPLIIQSGTKQPITLSPTYMLLSDLTAYRNALTVIASTGTDVWLASSQSQCSNGTKIGATKVISGSAVQWATEDSWSAIPTGSYAMCYASGNEGRWLLINVIVISRFATTLASNQKLLIGTGIYTSIITSGNADLCVAWTVAIATSVANCLSASTVLLSATFYQQGHSLFGTIDPADATIATGNYFICGSPNSALKALGTVDVAPQVKDSVVVPSNYFPEGQWAAHDITHVCGGALSPTPLGLVFPLSTAMWSAVGRIVPPKGYAFTGSVVANAVTAAATFVIPCPTCPVIAIVLPYFQGCVATGDLAWTTTLQYLTVSSGAAASVVSAAPHRAGVHFRLIVAEGDVSIATINKDSACQGSVTAAVGDVSASQTISFVPSTSLVVGKKYVACAHSPNSGPWVFAGVVSAVASSTSSGSGSVTSITGLSETIRIPAANNLTISLVGSFPDTSPGAYKISFAYAGTECSTGSAAALVAKTPLTVTSATTANCSVSLALTELVSGTAKVCLHSDDVTIVAIPATAYPTSVASVTFVYPTLKTVNYFNSLTIPANATGTYPLLLTDEDYTAGQIMFVERNADGTVTCNISSYATLVVVDANTKTAQLAPFTYPRATTFGTCVSGRIGDTVRWFPADFVLVTSKTGLSPNAYVLRLWFTNPLNTQTTAFTSFVSNRVGTIDGEVANYSYHIGQLSEAAAVVAPIPFESEEVTNAKVVNLYHSLVTGGGVLSFTSTNSDGSLATLAFVAVTDLNGAVIQGYETSAVSNNAITSTTAAPEDTSDYSLKAFLIFVCIAAPVTLGLVGHAFMNKINTKSADFPPPTSIVSGTELSPTDVSLKPIISRAEASQAATELSVNRESRAPEDANMMSSPIPEHPLRKAIGDSNDK